MGSSRTREEESSFLQADCSISSSAVLVPVSVCGLTPADQSLRFSRILQMGQELILGQIGC